MGVAVGAALPVGLVAGFEAANAGAAVGPRAGGKARSRGKGLRGGSEVFSLSNIVFSSARANRSHSSGARDRSMDPFLDRGEEDYNVQMLQRGCRIVKNR